MFVGGLRILASMLAVSSSIGLTATLFGAPAIVLAALAVSAALAIAAYVGCVKFIDNTPPIDSRHNGER
jgi:hypothetical protein